MENIKRLIFEGGGVKGIAYIGASEVLNNHVNIANIKQFAGSSAGAFTALLFALDYTLEDIKKILLKTNFADFADDSFGFIRDSYRLINTYGISKGEYLKRVIGQLILMKTLTTKTTFIQLYRLTGKELAITGTNLNKPLNATEYFHHLTTPNMEILTAVLISMSFPVVFKPVKYNDCLYVDGGMADNYPFDIFWNIYDKYRMIKEEITNSMENMLKLTDIKLSEVNLPISSINIDKNINKNDADNSSDDLDNNADNFKSMDTVVITKESKHEHIPMKLINSFKNHIKHVNELTDKINVGDMDNLSILNDNPSSILNQTYETYTNQTLGFRVDTAEEIQERLNNKNGKESEKTKINNLLDFLLSLVEVLTSTNDRLRYSEKISNRTIVIQTNISSIKFNLTDDDKNTLLESGKNACMEFIDKHNVHDMQKNIDSFKTIVKLSLDNIPVDIPVDNIPVNSVVSEVSETTIEKVEPITEPSIVKEDTFIDLYQVEESKIEPIIETIMEPIIENEDNILIFTTSKIPVEMIEEL